MTNSNIHFSSKTDLWYTPQDFFDKYDKKYGFVLDVCATDDNTKCNRWFTEEHDGLKQDWYGACWMNPPYGREIGKWMEKAYLAAKNNGAVVVCLVPSRTDTKWWHDFAMKGDIEFIKGRLKFGDAKNSAPFPSAVVIFK